VSPDCGNWAVGFPAPEICAVFGQTCDGLDVLSPSKELPDLDIGDLVSAENIGANMAATGLACPAPLACLAPVR
jgi:hypothetical protein